MIAQDLMAALLDSIKDPIVFVDTAHIIRYMNKAASHYYDDGANLMGTSVLDCHNAQSQETILKIFEAMKKGEDEQLITDNEQHRIFMRAVRNKDGLLLGYYERYEPPR